MIRRYLLNIILWLDIGINVLLLGGSPYETCSSRAGKQADKGAAWACTFCAMLSSLLGAHHCQNSEVDDHNKTLTNWWKG
jgi:hypothetical protein